MNRIRVPKPALAAILIGALALAALACGSDSTNSDSANNDDGGDERLTIVATTSIVADLVERVGGERVDVTSAVPAGADAHTFAVTPSLIARASEADLLVVVGTNFSGVEDQLAEHAGGAVLTLTDGMALGPFALAHADEEDEHDDGDEHGHEEEDGEHDDGDEHGHEEEEDGEHDDGDEHGHEEEEDGEHDDGDEHGHEEEEDGEHDDGDEHGHEEEDGEHDDGDEHGHEEEDGEHDDGDEHGHDAHDHGSVDPHFWMNIDFVIEAVDAIRGQLARLDPAGADAYRERADAYAAELRALDAEIAATLADLPEERRYLVTFHDAYGYFAARYGLTILGFVVEGPEEEPAAGALATLVERIGALGVPFIFTEPQFSARAIEQVARDSGATVRTIPSGSLAEEYPSYVEFLRAIARGIAE